MHLSTWIQSVDWVLWVGIGTPVPYKSIGQFLISAQIAHRVLFYILVCLRNVVERHGNYLHHQKKLILANGLKKRNVLFVRIIFMHIIMLKAQTVLKEAQCKSIWQIRNFPLKYEQLGVLFFLAIS